MPTSGVIRYTRLRRPASPSARFAADWAINPSFHLGQTMAAADLFSVLKSGAVRISVNQRYPLADAARAHRDLEARRSVGSSILVP